VLWADLSFDGGEASTLTFLGVSISRKAFQFLSLSSTQMSEMQRMTTVLGILFLVLGALMLLLPFLERSLPSLNELPWFLIYVYRRGDFFFVTSPILIILSLLSVVLYVVSRTN